jgi:hypothetical protein
MRVEGGAEVHLVMVPQAGAESGLIAGRLQRRHEHRRQNGDDRNHHQQLDECEPCVLVHHLSPEQE